MPRTVYHTPLFLATVFFVCHAAQSRAWTEPVGKAPTLPRPDRAPAAPTPDDAIAESLGAAQADMNNKRYDAVIAKCTAVLATQPDNYGALTMRGLAWHNKGLASADNMDLENAVADHTAALKIKPNDVRELLWRSASYMVKGDPQAALRDLSRAIELDPSSASAHVLRGSCYVRLRAGALALADYTKAIELDPNQPESYSGRALVYVTFAGMGLVPGNRPAVEDYQAAVQDYRQAIELCASDIAPLASAKYINELAWLQATCPEKQIRDGQAALAGAKRACELAEYKEFNYLDTLAAAYAETGDFENAITWEYGAVDLASGQPRVQLLQRAKLYEKHQPFRLPSNPVPPLSGPPTGKKQVAGDKQ
ncbi:MAG TPA: tetratricopeptide repeat protein [Pirellulales bacterium]